MVFTFPTFSSISYLITFSLISSTDWNLIPFNSDFSSGESKKLNTDFNGVDKMEWCNILQKPTLHAVKNDQSSYILFRQSPDSLGIRKKKNHQFPLIAAHTKAIFFKFFCLLKAFTNVHCFQWISRQALSITINTFELCSLNHH